VVRQGYWLPVEDRSFSASTDRSQIIDCAFKTSYPTENPGNLILSREELALSGRRGAAFTPRPRETFHLMDDCEGAVAETWRRKTALYRVKKAHIEAHFVKRLSLVDIAAHTSINARNLQNRFRALRDTILQALPRSGNRRESIIG
jgi:hypothetical protein